MRPFTAKQKYLIDRGNTLTTQLRDIVEKALQVNSTPSSFEAARHTYIFSGPGAGKTYTVNQTIEKHNVEPLIIMGASSMNALMMSLAIEVYSKPTGNIVVWIDDCDSIFADADALNVMKGALDEERNMFVWNKNMNSQISVLRKGNANSQYKADALESFQPLGGVGVEIPTDRVRFIITSNMELTPPNGKKLNSKRKMHEAAIRDRVNYRSFLLDSDESWGWLASIVMTSITAKSKVLPISKDQSRDLLEFMYQNWDKLTDVSMRAVRKLAQVMLDNPSSYPDEWATHFLER